MLYLANVGMSMLLTSSMRTQANTIHPILFRAVSIRMAPCLQHAHANSICSPRQLHDNTFKAPARIATHLTSIHARIKIRHSLLRTHAV